MALQAKQKDVEFNFVLTRSSVQTTGFCSVFLNVVGSTDQWGRKLTLSLQILRQTRVQLKREVVVEDDCLFNETIMNSRCHYLYGMGDCGVACT